MSSMTKDEITSAAIGRLRQHGCSVANILSTSDDVLGKLIYPVGFWKVSKYSITTTTTCRSYSNTMNTICDMNWELKLNQVEKVAYCEIG